MTFKNCKVIFICVFVALGCSHAEAQNEEEKDWLEFYYEAPTPDRFVQQMKDWAAEGVLDNENAKPVIIAFTSQVIRQNREKLAEWYEQLSGLAPNRKQVLHTGMLFSRTKEADDIMKERFGTKYIEQKRETKKILDLPLDMKSTPDMLWGFYYATGSEEAIRKIVLCFCFVHAPDDPGGVEVPKGYTPHYKELPNFAFNSLVANGERHKELVPVLEKILREDDTLIEAEKEGLYDVLSVLKPKEYPTRKGAEKA